MSLRKTIADAVADIGRAGFISQDQIERWVALIRQAAENEMMTQAQGEKIIKQTLDLVYQRQVERKAILRKHPGVPAFTLQNLKPHLHQELNRRIVANADRIKLDREQAMARTIQRFSNWGTSVPPAGSNQDLPKLRREIIKPLAQLPYHERRVAIDQGHKLVSAISEIIASDGGAIGGVWHSHYAEIGYNYRPDHKRRDGSASGGHKVYVMRGAWAYQQGLITKCDGFFDEMTAAGEEPFCRCYVEYFYTLADIPVRFWTAKGRAFMAQLASS